jgi:hypothetical protein
VPGTEQQSQCRNLCTGVDEDQNGTIAATIWKKMLEEHGER